MRFIILLLLIAVLYGDNHKPHHKLHIYKELSHLELSKEQHIQIRAILSEFRRELKEYRELEEEIEEKRKNLFLQDTIDTTEIDTLNTILDAHSHTIEKKLLLQIHAILTPQQREKFIDYFDDWEVR